MKTFTLLEIRWEPGPDKIHFSPRFHPRMQIAARSPADALRVGKTKFPLIRSTLCVAEGKPHASL
jgi:hypothetical protein